MTNDPKRPVMIQIDMTPDGEFLASSGMPRATFGSRMLQIAITIAALAVLGAIAAFSLWLFAVLIPVAIGAGIVAYGIFRYRLWQAQRSGRFTNFR